jgi:hypothetical protein
MDAHEFRSELPSIAMENPETGTRERATERRKYYDCRWTPSVSHCTLTMAGSEAHVLDAAIRHAVDVHGDEDTPELREKLRRSLRDVPAGDTLMA